MRLLLLTVLALGSLTGRGQTTTSLDILKELPLSQIEGLWSMTSENLLVLIVRNESGRLDMTVAPENVGSGFATGQLVGYLEPTADKDSYWLYLEDVPKGKTGIKNVLGTNPFSKRCVLTLKEEGEVLVIERAEKGLSIRPLGLFPKLNSLIRLNVKNPEGKVHEGFRKIYPGYDGEFGNRQRTVYF